MRSDLSTLDLATINAAHEVIVDALRSRCCEWEQESADATADGRLSNALMLQHWAFAADLLASFIGTEFSVLFTQALNARFGVVPETRRSAADQLLDALAIELASQQPTPN
ncbi:hypothetical protein [Synechococcus sp. CCY9202]|uniref:hypothetical protein n=1 Tax=Synechococcus sp. CCY9202 TaxID=174698 RepID=UPI002B20DB98|nr:hypothetical protein [Synechococcus sp. CCY9202]MEA5424503.1 hypothetical protein [Synechococcus sp. CCY9202]